MSASTIIIQIQTQVQAELPQLPPNLQQWAKNHLIDPIEMEMRVAESGLEKRTLWLVTSHTGSGDSNCRIVYEEATAEFGLEFTDERNQPLYLGSYGTFSDCVLSL